MTSNRTDCNALAAEIPRSTTPAESEPSPLNDREQLSQGYAEWRVRRLDQRLLSARGNRGQHWNHLITVVLYAPTVTSVGAIQRTLTSLRAQRYSNIEAILVMQDARADQLADLPDLTSLRGLFVEARMDVMDFLRSQLSANRWRGSHIMFARAGTLFDPDTFSLLNGALNVPAGSTIPELVICDHDRTDELGQHEDPSFLPGWDPDLLQSLDYVETAFIASRTLVLRMLSSGPVQSIHGWLQAVADQLDEQEVSHVSEPLVHIPDHYARPVIKEQVAHLSTTGLAGQLPSVAVIIPNKNRPDLLERCLSFLDMSCGFAPEIIIVDNASDDQRLHQFYLQMKERHGARIVSMNQPFNFSRMVNLGVAAAKSGLVLLLNNDVEVTSSGLLEQVITHASRPEVGVVGSRLLYPDGTVQHAGMMLGPGPCPIRQPIISPVVLRGASRDAAGYLGALRAVRNYQVVTGALLATRREVFLNAGGFDEVSLPVEYNDLDYCLRVRRLGLRVISLPLDGIFHAESSSRSSMPTAEVLHMRTEAMAVMAARWPKEFAHDPFWNPWVDIGERPDARFVWEVEDASTAGVPG